MPEMVGTKGPYASRRSRRILAVAVALLGVFALPVTIWAHPLGNFTINRYSRLELDARQVSIRYVVDMAEIPAFQERARIDADRDGTIAPAERDDYLATQVLALRRKLHLLFDGKPLPLELQRSTLEFPPGQGGLATLRLTADFRASLPAGESQVSGEYRDENYPGRVGWQEIVVSARSGLRLLESSVPSSDQSRELRSYPQDLLQSPPAVTSARFRFQRGAAESPALPRPAAAQATAGRQSDRFVALVTAPNPGPVALLVTLLAAFGWGGMHALAPGHGKTIVAAYLVGSRGTVRHALFLGVATTATHTAGVFALGMATIFASRFIAPEALYPWLGVISGSLVIAIGLSLARERLRRLFHPAASHSAHRHDHPHHVHQTPGRHQHPGHHHSHDHDHTHHHLAPGADGRPVTWRTLLALGISGGLLPCPSALVVMLGAIALQRVGFGLLLILAFSAGLAGVLSAIGILLVHAGRLFERAPLGGRLVEAIPALSALLITLAGVGITVRALLETGLV